MKKILLVYPRCKYPSGQPPLGLAALSAYIKQISTNISVELFDATFMNNSFKRFKNLCSEKNFDVLLFSVMSTMSSDAHRFAKIAKSKIPLCVVVFGGPHPTILPELCLADSHVDLVIRGEGERVIANLIAADFNPVNIKGVVYRAGDNRIVFNQEQSPIENIDALPFPDRSIFDMDRYVQVWNSMDSVASDLRGTSIIVSRGCPYRCTFCQPTLEKLFGKKIRKRSPLNVLKELIHLRDAYKINAFMFEDDTFMMDRQWVLEICELIKNTCSEMIWCCNMRANLCDEQLLRSMYDAGLRKINIGMETASQDVLDKVYKKGITIQQVIDAVSVCKKIGLRVQGYFMIGHPKETLEDVKQTIRFARNLDIDDVSFSIVTPFPGTALYDNERDLIEQSIESFDYYSTCVYKKECLSTPIETIRRMKSIGYFRFYMRPDRLLTQVRLIFSLPGLRKFFYKIRRVV